MRSVLALASPAVDGARSLLGSRSSASVARRRVRRDRACAAPSGRRSSTRSPSEGRAGTPRRCTWSCRTARARRCCPAGSSCRARATRREALKSAGFALPDQDGGAARRASRAPTSTPRAVAARRRSICRSSPCPSGPGRHTLDAAAVARRRSRARAATSSRSARRSTRSSSRIRPRPRPNAQPKPNPPPRVQREEWVALERGLAWRRLGAAWWVARRVARATAGCKRPKPVPPPPPPRAAVGGRLRAARRDASRGPARDGSASRTSSIA